MTVLLEIRQEGRTISRCDQRCYDAAGVVCPCVCGGHNHGVGLEIARELTRRWAPFLVAEFVEWWDLDPDKIQVSVLGEDWSLPGDLRDHIEEIQRGPARVAHAHPQDKGEGT